MAGYLSGVKFCGKDGSYALICGYAKALESGKNYCLKYLIPGDNSYNLPNNWHGYTFITAGGDFNLTSSGCYIPNAVNGSYTIILEEVGETCEHFIDFVDSTYVEVYDEAPPADERWLSVASTDTNGNRIPNVGFRLKNLDTGTSDNYSTDGSGYFERKIVSGNYQLYPSVPSGYTSTSASYSVWLVIDQYIVMEFKKAEEAKCYFLIHAKDVETQTGIAGVAIKVESAQGGTSTSSTNSTGHTTISPNCGFKYHITAIKDGYEDYGIYKDATPGNVSVSLPMKPISEEPCPAASAYFTIERYTAGVGEYIDANGLAHHNDKYQNHTWDWGDGIKTSGPHGQHKYTAPGSYTLVHDVENECGSTDSVTLEKQIVITEEGVHSLICPDVVYVDIPFTSVIRSDPNRSFKILGMFGAEYGTGSTDSEGTARIECVVDAAGTYRVYGYSDAEGYAGNFIQTNDVEFIAETGQPPVPPDPDDPDGGFKISVPSFTMTETEFVVSGTHPKFGQAIDIKVDKSLAVDPVIGVAIVQGDGTFEATCEIEDVGFHSVYAYDPTWVEEWFPDIIPDGWIPGKGFKSSSSTIVALSWMIVASILLAIGLILEKKYNKLGIFGGKK